MDTHVSGGGGLDVVGVVVEDGEIRSDPSLWSKESKIILSSCHSLYPSSSSNAPKKKKKKRNKQDEPSGDNLEVAIWRSLRFKIPSPDDVVLSSTVSISILKRFPFSSSDRRMSNIILYQSKKRGDVVKVVTKGAPEAVIPLLSAGSPSEHLSTVSENLMKEGFRVLCLASKLIHQSQEEMKLESVERVEVENDLTFEGFVLLSSPVNEEVCEMIQTLKEGSHHLIMLTGDALPTALSVASRCGICEIGEVGMVGSQLEGFLFILILNEKSLIFILDYLMRRLEKSVIEK